MVNDEFGRLRPVEYEDYPSSPSNKGSPNRKSPSKYDSESLKKIGNSCKNRLPPASAVQAMFLCEYSSKASCRVLWQFQPY